MVRGKFLQTFQSLVFIGILYCCYLLILLSIPYLSFEPGIEFLETKQLIYHLKWWRYSFYFHIFSSPIVIVAGLLQFNRILLHGYKKLHRFLGITYVLMVGFIAGPSALLMGLYANGGYLAQISFVLLSGIWITFTFLAYNKVRKHDYLAHSKWMLRSYALTLSAVTLRIYAYLFDFSNIPLSPKETYILLGYLSWIPNLLIAEVVIRSEFLTRLLVPRQKF